MRWILALLAVTWGCRDTAPDIPQQREHEASDGPDSPAWSVGDPGAVAQPMEGEGEPPAEAEGEGEGEGEPELPPAEERPDPVAPPECDTRFRLELGRAGADVGLAGEWAGWDPAAAPMTDGNGEGVYEIAVPVPAGSWAYKLVVDGDWIIDPGHERTRFVDGVANSRIDVPECGHALVRPVRTEVSPAGEVTVWDNAGGSARFPDLPEGRHDLPVGDGLAPVWIEDEPFDVRDGPIYFVLVDRFRNGDPANDSAIGPPARPSADWHGGDLAGVLAALEEGWFDALGVRTLWLSPLNEAFPGLGAGKDGRQYSGYHGYWPISARTVEPRLGSLDELKALTAAAHARGIRVIVDLVWNQAHRDHEYVSAHPEWFRGDGGCVCGAPGCDWDERALDCWFTDYLPDVDWTHMEAVDAMEADALWWLTTAGLDGFRVDAVKHMEEIAVTTLRTAIDRELGGGNATFHLVGETFTGGDDAGRQLVARYVGPSRLHAQFDFPLFWTAMSVFAQESAGFVALEAAAAASDAAYPSRWMSPFLGNHDVERFLSRAAGDLSGDPVEQGFTNPPPPPDSDLPYERARLAFAWLLTQPGAPLIYYGDEVGLPGAGDPDNRRPMRFSDDLNSRESALLTHIRTWSQHRAASEALRRGALKTLHVEDDVYIYQRGTGPGAMVVALNRSPTPRTVEIQIEGAPTTLDLPARDAIVVALHEPGDL